MRAIPIRPLAVIPGDCSGLPAPPPLSLYVHFPWCVRKCPYCDFNSHALAGEVPDQAYVDALLADLQAALPAIWGRRVNTVFIGGGTPSLMSVEALGRLLEGLRALANLAPAAEVTLEANPGTVDASRFAGFRAAGVTRLSLGVQSFDDRLLAAIGRAHDGAAARAAAEQAVAGFDQVNLDLMYGLPGQTLAGALSDVDTALGLAPAHLSCYHLGIEPNTEFHARPPPLPDADLAADMQEAIEQRLAGAGFENYETSAFARRGARCRHNLNYWQFGDYLGIGAGAHGKLSSHDRIVRELRHRHPRAYLEGARRGSFVQTSSVVPAAELPFEFLMNALRLREGFSPELFAATTGLPFSLLEPRLAQARAAGLVEFEHGMLRPSERGRRFLNDLLGLFLPERDGR